VFEVFEQGARTLDRSAGGLGIGLSIVRSIVILHGGEVSAKSDGPGRGSEFSVRLPLHTAGAEPLAREAAPNGTPRAASSRRVLVVDDNADGAEMLALALEGLGHATAVAHDGPQALELARDLLPDVALLDIGLPEMDGFELARRLQSELGDRAPVMIAVTGYGQASDRARTREAGFAHHLVKPIDLDELGTLVAAATAGTR
jgi:CheY-like chemotaxis protein